MKKLFLLSILFNVAIIANAQYNALGMYNSHFTFNRAEMLPSALGNNDYKFEMRLLPNPYVYAGNTLMAIEDILYPDVAKIDDALNEITDFGVFGSGVEIPFLAFSYKLNKGEKELLTLALTNKTRVLGNMLIDGNFLKLLWKGNKQFEGKSVNFDKFGLTAISASELALGLAFPLNIGESLNLRVGANLKYLLSAGGAYLPNTSATFETGLHGSVISLDNLSYRVDYAAADDDQVITGQGIGVDLGATINFQENTSVSAAILDIGSISYDQNTESYEYNAGTFTFEGIVIDNLFDIDNLDPDSVFLEDLTAVEDSNQTFSINLPTRMVFQFEKTFGNKQKKNGIAYNKHGIYLTYIQGFKNTAGSTTEPYFSGGYSYSFGDVVNLGPTISYGGYGGFGMGMFLSAKAGPFKVGIGSNTGLTYLVMPGVAKSADFSFMTTWSFGGKNDTKKEKKGKGKDKSKKEEYELNN